jgi:predicted metal-dependent hydrolase
MAGLFQRIRRVLDDKPLDPARITIGSIEINVDFRRHARARRLVLRLKPEGNGAVVTVPHGITRSQALAFVQRSSEWLAARLERAPDAVILAPGSIIPLRGEDHEVRRLDSRRGTVAADAAQKIIYVPGEPVHGPRRLLDWLKATAKADLVSASQKYAEAMAVSFTRITVRDQRSRWGSCSHAGALSYSWRLILTPPYVLDYVAAHEVAHLLHMDHGTGFWRLVLRHCPDAARARDWLKRHGHNVHRFIV